MVLREEWLPPKNLLPAALWWVDSESCPRCPITITLLKYILLTAVSGSASGVPPMRGAFVSYYSIAITVLCVFCSCRSTAAFPCRLFRTFLVVLLHQRLSNRMNAEPQL